MKGERINENLNNFITELANEIWIEGQADFIQLTFSLSEDSIESVSVFNEALMSSSHAQEKRLALLKFDQFLRIRNVDFGNASTAKKVEPHDFFITKSIERSRSRVSVKISFSFFRQKCAHRCVRLR